MGIFYMIIAAALRILIITCLVHQELDVVMEEFKINEGCDTTIIRL